MSLFVYKLSTVGNWLDFNIKFSNGSQYFNIYFDKTIPYTFGFLSSSCNFVQDANVTDILGKNSLSRQWLGLEGKLDIVKMYL